MKNTQWPYRDLGTFLCFNKRQMEMTIAVVKQCGAKQSCCIKGGFDIFSGIWFLFLPDDDDWDSEKLNWHYCHDKRMDTRDGNVELDFKRILCWTHAPRFLCACWRFCNICSFSSQILICQLQVCRKNSFKGMKGHVQDE